MPKQNDFTRYKKRVSKDTQSIHRRLWSWGEAIISRQTDWRKSAFTIIGVLLYCCTTPFLIIVSMCLRSGQAGLEDETKRISRRF
jgi:hypothetical protein